MITDSMELDHKFQARASEVGARTHSYVLPDLKGPKGEILAIRVATLGARDARTRIVISAGIHGLERSPGAAIERAWMRGAAKMCERFPQIGFTFVDNLNPFGHAYALRSDHENIDCSRNFVDFKKPLPLALNYRHLAHAFTPRTFNQVAFDKAWMQLAAFGLMHGVPALKQAVVGGQYEFPDGLYYGGTKPSWTQQQWKNHILPNHVLHPDLRHLWHIDIHTGEGAWGECQLMINAAADAGLNRRMSRLQLPSMVRFTEQKFGHISGDIIDSWPSMNVPPTVVVTPFTLELGTTRMPRCLKGADVLSHLMRRNALRQICRDDHPAASSIIAAARQMFAPSSPGWQHSAREHAGRVFDGLRAALII